MPAEGYRSASGLSKSPPVLSLELTEGGAPMATVAIVLCDKCGSERVDVAAFRGTGEREFRVKCFACNHESPLIGFTLGRADVAEATLREARAGRSGHGTTKMPTVTRE